MEEEYFEGYDEVQVEESAQFILDTGYACFLCLKDISPAGGSGDDDYPIKCEDGLIEEQNTFQLSKICRYLNLNVSGIFTDVGPHFERNLSVNLCDGCSLVAGKLSDLCGELELLQMKVDHTLGTFSGILEKSEGESWRLDQHGYSAVKQIRMETRKKCLRKLKSVLPKVLLSKENHYSHVDHSSPEPVINFPQHPIHVNKIQRPKAVPSTPISGPSSISNNSCDKQTSSLSINHHVMCYLCNTKFQRKGDYLRHQKFDCPFLPRGDTRPSLSKAAPGTTFSVPTSNPPGDSIPSTKSKMWKCPSCPSEYRHRRNLLAHQRQKHNPTNVNQQKHQKCHLCIPPRTMLKPELRRHQILRHAEHFLVALKMPHVSLSDFKIYIDHVFKLEILSASKTANSSLKCPYCPSSYQEQNGLRRHLFSLHRQLLEQKISELQKTSTVTEITDMTVNATSGIFKCEDCGHPFVHKASLQRHKLHFCPRGPKIGLPTTKMRIKCGNCPRKFGSEAGMKHHVELEHAELDGEKAAPKLTRKCNLCNPPCDVLTRNYKRHKICQHVEAFFVQVKMSQLSPAEFKLYCEYAFKLEVFSCKKMDGSRRQCSHCPTSYSDDESLRRHLFLAHRKLMEGKIYALQKKFSVVEVEGLIAETRKSDEIKCDKCGATFLHKPSLARHKKLSCAFRAQPGFVETVGANDAQIQLLDEYGEDYAEEDEPILDDPLGQEIFEGDQEEDVKCDINMIIIPD